MKFRYTRCYQLSLALAAMPVLISHAQNAGEVPVQAVEEKLKEQTQDTSVASGAIVQDIEAARLSLEEAKRLADAATGVEKTRLLADVEAAEKLLIAAKVRGESMNPKDIPSKEEDKSNTKDEGEKRDKKPESAKAPKDAKEDKEKADEGMEVEEKRGPEVEVKSEEESIDKVNPGEVGDPAERTDNKKEKVAPEEERETKAPDVSELETAMEPEPQKEAVVKPAEVAESEVEVKEAKEADQAVDLTTQQVEKDADRRKLDLKNEGDARALIRDLIGRDSEVSKAEAEREVRLEPRFQGNGREDRRGENRDELREASEYLLRQLGGNAKLEEAPAFFRRPAEVDPRRDRKEDGVDRRNAPPVFRDQAPPRYYHEGRRYVRFDSRNSIPAILLAAAALDRVIVQPANRTDSFFQDDQGPDYYANELPPENFRGSDAVVVSYPVSTSSMISSNDIIFAQGSTRFADAHSYDMVMALSDAMANPTLKDARFVIEGHASAEGSYENNMVLSQRRAEAIVRDMVREGIDPERLIPVGYGESEARYPADSAERLRGQDRNVRVFKIGAE